MYNIRGTKTDNADRIIPIFPQLRQLLETMDLTQEYLFPYTPNAVSLNFKRLKKKYGYKFRIHDLRHTFSTRCLEESIPVKYVQTWLGHADYSTTMNIYSHVNTLGQQKQATKVKI